MLSHLTHDPECATDEQEAFDPKEVASHGLTVGGAALALATLLALTGLTVLVSQVELGGQINLLVALLIAALKAAVVVAFFMHVIYERGMTRVIIGATAFTVALFMGLTMSDLLARGTIDREEFVLIAAPDVAFQARISTPEVARGRELFVETCSSCHGPGGRGLPGLGKDMTASTYIRGVDDRQLLRFLKQGRLPGDPLNTTNVAMPPRGGNPTLNDGKLKDIIKFVRVLAPYEAGGVGGE